MPKDCNWPTEVLFAVQVVTLMDERGIKIDVLHYTTLITACGAVGNTDRAFRLFQDLKLSKQRPDSQVRCCFCLATTLAFRRAFFSQILPNMLRRMFRPGDRPAILQPGCRTAAALSAPRPSAPAVVDAPTLPPPPQAYGALIAAFASAVQRDVRVSSDKREQLVLLERAMLKVEDASRGNAMMLELPVWNALIALAARSGQLDRAFQVVDMMSAKGVKADATTYGTLIDACVAAKEEDMARRLYVKAIAEVRGGCRPGMHAIADA